MLAKLYNWHQCWLNALCVCVHVFAVVHRFPLPSGPNAYNERGFYGRIICMFLINRYISQGFFGHSIAYDVALSLYNRLFSGLHATLLQRYTALNFPRCAYCFCERSGFLLQRFSRSYSNIIFRHFAKCLHALRNLSVRAEVKRCFTNIKIELSNTFLSPSLFFLSLSLEYTRTFLRSLWLGIAPPNSC